MAREWVLGLLVVLVGAGPAGAAVVGNPAATVGHRGLAMGLESEHFEDVFGGDEVLSQRYLARLTYGVWPHLDVFVKAGSAALSVTPANATAESMFEGDLRVALGTGARFDTGPVPGLLGCRAFAVAQVLRFDSQGEFLRHQSHKDWTWDERLDTAYRWTEVAGALGLSRPLATMDVYGGMALTRVSGRVDREQYVISEEVSTRVGEGSETFAEGPGLGLFCGLDYTVSGDVMLSAEYQLNDRRHGTFFIGICETTD